MTTLRLLSALVGWETWRTPARLLGALSEDGITALDTALDGLAAAQRSRLQAMAEALAEAGVNVLIFGSDEYPAKLAALKSPPPVVMYIGDPSLLDGPAIGVCGARAASETGLKAATLVGEIAADRGWTVIAGNAIGVDQAAQNAAHERGGRVVVVLPEGISESLNGDPEQDGLVLSQYPPSQPWSVGGAMGRNTTIAALADALVVIEAGETGGTRAAGESALRMQRPVFTIQFGGDTPPGNLALVRMGARPVESTGELVAAFEQLPHSVPAADQLALPL